ncbi:hypothetical protein [Crocinitomix catalasitica]|uniref:hypothetical protein n=1 Tax=Crocinitomix catalasitica TaxID=184607 RepID=UPI00048445EF|nr:hypothetical protein [Crocinitomix catalasitica]
MKTNTWIIYCINFILVVLIQGLVINNIEINTYLNPMIYPVMIMMLPFELNILVTMLIALVLGVSVDAMSNTFGLHTSAALIIGYLRPTVLKLIEPRDSYDTTLLPSIHDMGKLWFLSYASILIAMHHIWFFTIEILKFDQFFFILLKTIFSSIFSLLLIILFQYIFYKPTKK